MTQEVADSIPAKKVSVLVVDDFSAQLQSGSEILIGEPKEKPSERELDASHGYLVASLIAGDTPCASPAASVEWTINASGPYPDFGKKSVPQIMNVSLSKIVKRPKLQNFVDSLLARGTIGVFTSGNTLGNNNSKMPPDEESSKSSGIIVGSIEPRGLPVSAYSQHVTILAPGGQTMINAVRARTKSGLEARMQASSAAAPQVSAALANVMAIIPELKYAMAKDLLKKTSTPLLSSFQNPQMNGAGLLNAYKLFMVAQRINMFCKNSESTDRKRSCLERYIQDAEKAKAVYSFPPSEAELKEVKKAFAYCTSEGGEIPDCNRQIPALKTLRKLFNLDPENNELRRLLACIYKQNDYPTLSTFFRSRELLPLLEGKIPEDGGYNGLRLYSLPEARRKQAMEILGKD